MTVSASKRAPSHFLTEGEAANAQAALTELLKIDQPNLPQPPIHYLTQGLRAIYASRRIGYDSDAHPHIQPKQVVQIQFQLDPSDAESDAFARQVALLLPHLVIGAEWHYSGQVLCENLKALREGRLMFLDFVKEP